jgi:hypothetical protein
LRSALRADSTSFCPVSIAIRLLRAVRGSYPPAAKPLAVATYAVRTDFQRFGGKSLTTAAVMARTPVDMLGPGSS